MKKIIYIFLLIPLLSFSQTSQEYSNDLQELNRKELQEIHKQSNLPDGQRASIIAKIQSAFEEKRNVLRAKYENIEQKEKYENNLVETQRNNLEVDNRNQKNIYNQQVLQQLRESQSQSQNNYNQEISNSLNSLSRGMQAMAYQNVKNELNRRQKVANNFASFHSGRINKLTELYSQIPKNNFAKTLNGIYSAHYFNTRKYSFVNNQELVTETPCLVKIENNVVKNIYLYGKEKFEINYPSKFPANSKISNGIVKYSDYETLETTTLVIIEPYLVNNAKSYNLNIKDVSYLTIWSNDKKEEGKIIYIQELDSKGNIFREINTPIVYAKNEKLIDLENITQISVNSGNSLLFFGEVTETPYGRIPLYPRMSKSDLKPLQDGESRLVEIKKYRE